MTSGLVTVLVCLSCGLWIGADATQCGNRNVRMCPNGWSLYGNRCFLFINRQLNWAQSESFCRALGGHLASFHSYSEFTFLRNLVYIGTRSFRNTWVGGNDRVRDGWWRWTDGTGFNYRRWHRGEPNNWFGREDCMEINFRGPWANDEKCHRSRPFICSRVR